LNPNAIPVNPQECRIVECYTLVHGTTEYCALSIIANGPDPRHREFGGLGLNEGFSAYIVGYDQSHFGLSTMYSVGKVGQAIESGQSDPAMLIPVLLFIHNVPREVLDAANRDGYFPISNGLVQLDTGAGIEEFMRVRGQLTYEIQRLSSS
jgi:hypothetical protein